MTLPLVLLFDVDGTLLRTGGAGIRAFERGFETALGWTGALAGLPMAGQTDLGIAQAAAQRRRGRELTPEELMRVLDHYLAALPGELAAAAEFRVCPGIPEFLEAHRHDAGLRLGLGTGNLEAGARLKLERGGINAYFAFGGFGSDARERAEVLRIGVQRAEAVIGAELPAHRVVVIGDTPLDVKAGRDIGAHTLAVATGPYPVEALTASGAEAVLEDFSSTERVARLLAVWS